MTLTTHAAMPVGARAGADANSGALGSSHLAMIRRFAKFAVMTAGFVVIIVAVMSIKYAAFFLRFAH